MKPQRIYSSPRTSRPPRKVHPWTGVDGHDVIRQPDHDFCICGVHRPMTTSGRLAKKATGIFGRRGRSSSSASMTSATETGSLASRKSARRPCENSMKWSPETDWTRTPSLRHQREERPCSRTRRRPAAPVGRGHHLRARAPRVGLRSRCPRRGRSKYVDAGRTRVLFSTGRAATPPQTSHMVRPRGLMLRLQRQTAGAPAGGRQYARRAGAEQPASGQRVQAR